MAKDATDKYHCLVSVVGYVPHGKLYRDSSFGTGKSCLCCRLTHSSVDDYIDDHPSLLALHEFESKVICTENFLYWGPKELELSGRGGRQAKVTVEVLEHTLFYHDETSKVFPSFRALHDPDKYAKQAIVSPDSSRKISYYSRDYIGFPDRYKCLPYPSNVNRLPRGFIIVCDVSVPQPQFEAHLSATEQIAHRLYKDSKMPIIIAATKRDAVNAKSLQRLMEWASKKRITVIETSAKENINVKAAFTHIVAKILKSAKLSSTVLNYSDAVGVSLSDATNARSNFKTHLKKYVKSSNSTLSSVEKEPAYLQALEILGKFGADEIYARHLLEVRDTEILSYSGVKENPDMRMEMLEQFVDDIMLELIAHKRILRSMINTLVTPSDVYVNEGRSSNHSSPQKQLSTTTSPNKPPLSTPDDIYDEVDDFPPTNSNRTDQEPPTGDATIDDEYDNFEPPFTMSTTTTVIKCSPADSPISIGTPEKSKLLRKQQLPSTPPTGSPAVESKPIGESISQELKRKLRKHIVAQGDDSSSTVVHQPDTEKRNSNPSLPQISIGDELRLIRELHAPSSSPIVKPKQVNAEFDSTEEKNETGDRYGFLRVAVSDVKPSITVENNSAEESPTSSTDQLRKVDPSQTRKTGPPPPPRSPRPDKKRGGPEVPRKNYEKNPITLPESPRLPLLPPKQLLANDHSANSLEQPIKYSSVSQLNSSLVTDTKVQSEAITDTFPSVQPPLVGESQSPSLHSKSSSTSPPPLEERDFSQRDKHVAVQLSPQNVSNTETPASGSSKPKPKPKPKNYSRVLLNKPVNVPANSQQTAPPQKQNTPPIHSDDKGIDSQESLNDDEIYTSSSTDDPGSSQIPHPLVTSQNIGRAMSPALTRALPPLKPKPKPEDIMNNGGTNTASLDNKGNVSSSDDDEDVYVSSSINPTETEKPGTNPPPSTSWIPSVSRKQPQKSSSVDQAKSRIELPVKERSMTTIVHIKPSQYEPTRPSDSRRTTSVAAESKEYKPRLEALRKKVEEQKQTENVSNPPPSYPAPPPPSRGPAVPVKPKRNSTTGLTGSSVHSTSHSDISQAQDQSPHMPHSRSMEINSMNSTATKNYGISHTLPRNTDKSMGISPPPLPPRTADMLESISSEDISGSPLSPPTVTDTPPPVSSPPGGTSSTSQLSPTKSAHPKNRKNYIDAILKKITPRKDSQDKDNDGDKVRDHHQPSPVRSPPPQDTVEHLPPVPPTSQNPNVHVPLVPPTSQHPLSPPTHAPSPRFVRMKGRPLPPAPENAVLGDDITAIDDPTADYEPVDELSVIRSSPPRGNMPLPVPPSPHRSHMLLPVPPSPQHTQMGVPTPQDLQNMLQDPSQRATLMQILQMLHSSQQQPNSLFGQPNTSLLQPQPMGRPRPQRSQSLHHHHQMISNELDDDGYELTDGWNTRLQSPDRSLPPSLGYDYPEVRGFGNKLNGGRKRMCPPRSTSQSPRRGTKARAPSPPLPEDSDDYMNMQGGLADFDYENFEVINSLRVGKSLDNSGTGLVPKRFGRHNSMDDIHIYYNMRDDGDYQDESTLSVVPPRQPRGSNDPAVMTKSVDSRSGGDDVDEETGQKTSNVPKPPVIMVRPLPPRNRPRVNIVQSSGDQL